MSKYFRDLDIKRFYVILEKVNREEFFHACEIAQSKEEAMDYAKSDRYYTKEIIVYDVLNDEVIHHWDKRLGVLR